MAEEPNLETPTAPPTEPGAIPPARSDSGPLEGYHAIADTVGGLPSLRWKDNLFQAVFIVVVTGGCAVIGWSLWGTPGLLGMLIAGLIGSTMLSGIVLMVLGWVRGARRLSRCRD